MNIIPRYAFQSARVVVVIIGLMCGQIRANPPADNGGGNAGIANPGQARKLAIAAFLRGDQSAADLAVADAIAARNDAGGTDVSTSEECALLSFALHDLNDHVNAQRLAAASMVALNRREQGNDKFDRLRAALLTAHLHERVLFNDSNARAAYHRALVLDRDNVTAKEGLARLDLAQAVVNEKIKEQQLLRQRGK